MKRILLICLIFISLYTAKASEIILADTTISAIKTTYNAIITDSVSGTYTILLPTGTYTMGSGVNDNILCLAPAVAESSYTISIRGVSSTDFPVIDASVNPNAVFRILYNNITIEGIEIITSGTAVYIGDPEGSGQSGAARNVSVKRCNIHGSDGGVFDYGIRVAKNADWVTDSLKVENCIITDSCMAGIYVNNTSGVSYGGLSVQNNSILMVRGAPSGYGLYLSGAHDPGTVIQNNMLLNASTAGIGLVGTTGLTVSNCLFYNNANPVSGGSPALTAPQYSEPYLSGIRSRYYHVGYIMDGTSPAVDAGTATGAPAIDLYGNARSGNPDIGAIEYNGSYSFSDTIFVNSSTGSDANRGNTLSAPMRSITEAYTKRVPTPLYYPVVMRVMQGIGYTESDGANFGVRLTGKETRGSGHIRLEAYDDYAPNRPVIRPTNAAIAAVYMQGSGISLNALKIYVYQESQHGIYTDGYLGSSDIEINRCLIRPLNKGGKYVSGATFVSPISDIKIENCLIDYNGDQGAIFLIDDNAAADTSLDSVIIVYNTIYMENGSGNSGISVSMPQAGGVNNVTVKHNIFDSPGAAAFWNNSGFSLGGANSMSHNCIYNGLTETGIADTVGNILMNPVFFSIDVNDSIVFLKPSDSSICISAGLTSNSDGLSSGIDYDSTLRPTNGTYNIGAYEASIADTNVAEIPSGMVLILFSPTDMDSTFIVTFLGLNQLDSREVDSLGLWINPASAPSFPLSQAAMNQCYSLSEMKMSSDPNVFTDTLRAYIPGNEYYFSFSVRGANGRWNPGDSTKVYSGNVYVDSTFPPNFYSLTVDSVTYTSLRLSWAGGDSLALLGIPVDSIGIWYNSGESAAYPDSAGDGTLLFTTPYATSGNGSYRVTALQHGRTYYFSMFVRNAENGKWSRNHLSRANQMLAELPLYQDTTGPVNNASLSVSNITNTSVRIGWSGTFEPNSYINILADTSGYPSTGSAIRNVIASANDVSDTLIYNLTPQTTYYFSAYTRDSVGNNSLTACTASAYTPLGGTSTTVNLFGPVDTILAVFDDGDTVWVGWSVAAYGASGIDVKFSYHDSSVDVSGLAVPAGNKFIQFYSELPLGENTLYLKWPFVPHPTLPISQAAVYFYSDTDERWYIDDNARIDPVSGIVETDANRVRGIYRVLYDTIPLSVRHPSNTGKHMDGIVRLQNLYDTLYITDNVGDIEIYTNYTIGGMSELYYDTLSDTVTPGVETMKQAYIDKNYIRARGLKAYLTITDGIYDTTFDISYPVISPVNEMLPHHSLSPSYNFMSLPLNMDDPSCLSVLSDIANDAYDPTKWRLFEYGGTEYVEFSEATASTHLMTPGHGYWLITTENPAAVNVGSGKSVSLGQSFKIPVPAGQWTDFGIPYNFSGNDSGICLGDILDSSGLSGTTYFYSYSGDEGFVPMFTANIPQTASVLSPWRGYTVYSSDADTLKIPAISYRYSSYGADAAKRSASAGGRNHCGNSWHVQVSASWEGGKDSWNGAGECPNQNKSSIFIPKPVSPFRDVRLYTVREKDGGENVPVSYVYHHSIGEGKTWKFIIENQNGKSRNVKVSLALSGEVPARFRHVVLDSTNAALRFIEEQPGFCFNIEPMAKKNLTVISGTNEYLDNKLKEVFPIKEFFLGSVYPNPFNPLTTICYHVPYASSNMKILMNVYNTKGMLVHCLLNRYQNPGVHRISWNGKTGAGKAVASGVYFLKMTASVNGKRSYSKVQKLVLLK